jgi:hypothetical protein
MDPTTLIIEAIAGAAGGNIAGLLNKARSYGPLINTVLGVLGGLGGGAALGGPLTGMLGGNATAGSATASAIGGILIPLIAGFFKKPAA